MPEQFDLITEIIHAVITILLIILTMGLVRLLFISIGAI
jgi:hypothetical protein